MGVADLLDRRMAGLAEQVTARWDAELSYDLNRASIDIQTSSELRDSLKRIDELIEDPSSISALWIDHTGGIFEVEEAAADPAARLDPDNMLLNRREYILTRLQRATEVEKADLSREHAEPSLNDEARQSIESELEQLEVEEARLEALRSETQALQENRAFERQLQAAEFELEAEERRAEIARREKLAVAEAKSRWWQSRLSRDSIAAVVGGVLLIGFATAVIVAMFTDTAITDVVQNSFLLILGYFFGAAVASRPGTETNRVDSSGSGEPS